MKSYRIELFNHQVLCSFVPRLFHFLFLLHIKHVSDLRLLFQPNFGQFKFKLTPSCNSQHSFLVERFECHSWRHSEYGALWPKLLLRSLLVEEVAALLDLLFERGLHLHCALWLCTDWSLAGHGPHLPVLTGVSSDLLGVTICCGHLRRLALARDPFMGSRRMRHLRFPY